MFKSLFRRGVDPRAAKLPSVHTFVDVVVAARAVRSVSVETIDAKGIVTRESLGQRGESAVLVYANPSGRFRARSRIIASDETTTTFELPRSVENLGAAQGEQKRQSVRLDALIVGHWRFAPGGKGIGEFTRGSVRDISRGGCALITERMIKTGTMLELKLPLRSSGEPVVLVGEVMRHQVVESSGKHSHGLRFIAPPPDEEQAIAEYINRKQADLRSRGLA